MKKLPYLSSLCFILLLCNACAVGFHHGSMSSDAILDPNFKPIDIAYGYSKSTRVLGIGGMGKDALVLDAKRSLYLTNKLAKGQVYANFTVDFKESFYFFLVHTTRVTVSADILDSSPALADDSTSFYDRIKERYTYQVQAKEKYSDKTNQFKLGMPVYFYIYGNRLVQGKIFRLWESEAKVRYADRKGKFRFLRVSYLKLYSEKPTQKP